LNKKFLFSIVSITGIIAVILVTGLISNEISDPTSYLLTSEEREVTGAEIQMWKQKIPEWPLVI
jgi:hypothetical protein